MADKKAERKRVHDTLHNPSEFEGMLSEWDQYHGRRVDDVTGEDMSFDMIRRSEMARLFEEYLTQLQKDMKGKELDPVHAKGKIFDIAKKTYLASVGLTEAGSKKAQMKGLEERVKDFLVQAAGGAQAGIANYEQAIEAIMTSPDPFGMHNREGMSKALQSLLNSYVDQTYKSKQLKAEVKGKETPQTQRRLDYLTRELAHSEHKEQLESRYTSLLQENYGDKARFHKRAVSMHILNEASSLMGNGRVSSLKAQHLTGVSGGKLKKAKEGYNP